MTKIVFNIKHKVRGQIKVFGISTLTRRRNRGDMIKYILANKLDHINCYNKNVLRPPIHRHRSHYAGEPVRKPGNRNNFFFKNRIIDVWTALSDDIVNAKTVNSLTSVSASLLTTITNATIDVEMKESFPILFNI